MAQRTFSGWFLALGSPSLLSHVPCSPVPCLPSAPRLGLQLCSRVLPSCASRLQSSAASPNILSIHKDNRKNRCSNSNSIAKREKGGASPLMLSPNEGTSFQCQVTCTHLKSTALNFVTMAEAPCIQQSLHEGTPVRSIL